MEKKIIVHGRKDGDDDPFPSCWECNGCKCMMWRIAKKCYKCGYPRPSIREFLSN